MVGWMRKKSAKPAKGMIDKWEYFGISFDKGRFRQLYRNKVYKTKKKANKVKTVNEKKLKGKNPKVVQVYGD